MKGGQNAADLTDTGDAAHDDNGGQDRENDTGDDGLNADSLLHGQSHGVGIHDGGNDDRIEQDQKAHDLGQPLPAGGLRHIVHRAADKVALAVLLTVLDAEENFSILGRRADRSGNERPEQSAGAADDQSGRNAGGIAGTDDGGNRRHSSLERRNLAFAAALRLFLLGESLHIGLLDHEAQIAELNALELERQEQADGHDHNDRGSAPYEAVNSIVD